MKAFIRLAEDGPMGQDALWAHLLPEPLGREQAAFIFAEVQRTEDQIILTAKEIYLAQEGDFETQDSDYLELTDEARVSVIKRAHATGTSIIEVHSHPFRSPRAAMFSFADIHGLRETVPNMWWRLKKRPYGALVVAPNGCDALVWHENPETPLQVEGIIFGDKILKTSQLTLGGHHERRITI